MNQGQLDLCPCDKPKIPKQRYTAIEALNDSHHRLRDVHHYANTFANAAAKLRIKQLMFQSYVHNLSDGNTIQPPFIPRTVNYPTKEEEQQRLYNASIAQLKSISDAKIKDYVEETPGLNEGEVSSLPVVDKLDVGDLNVNDVYDNQMTYPEVIDILHAFKLPRSQIENVKKAIMAINAHKLPLVKTVVSSIQKTIDKLMSIDGDIEIDDASYSALDEHYILKTYTLPAVIQYLQNILDFTRDGKDAGIMASPPDKPNKPENNPFGKSPNELLENNLEDLKKEAIRDIKNSPRVSQQELESVRLQKKGERKVKQLAKPVEPVGVKQEIASHSSEGTLSPSQVRRATQESRATQSTESSARKSWAFDLTEKKFFLLTNNAKRHNALTILFKSLFPETDEKDIKSLVSAEMIRRGRLNEDLPQDQLVLDTLKQEYPTGTGIRRRKYGSHSKITKSGKFGNLKIDMTKLHQLYLHAKKGRETKIKGPISHHLYELLTKKYDKRKKYSKDSLEQFKKIVELAGIPQEKIGKQNKKGKILRGEPVDEVQKEYIYYSNPDELKRKLKVLVGSYNAGTRSTELENEISHILDTLYKENHISRAEYDKVIERLL